MDNFQEGLEFYIQFAEDAPPTIAALAQFAPAWVIGDLDCGDIGYRRFTVYAPDSHGFDGDGDGVGCES